MLRIIRTLGASPVAWRGTGIRSSVHWAMSSPALLAMTPIMKISVAITRSSLVILWKMMNQKKERMTRVFYPTGYHPLADESNLSLSFLQPLFWAVW